MGILSFPLDFPHGIDETIFSNSSRVKGFIRRSFSSAVNCGTFKLERYAMTSDSEQASLFSNREDRCEAAIEHISLWELVIPLAPLRNGIVLETDLAH